MHGISRVRGWRFWKSQFRQILVAQLHFADGRATNWRYAGDGNPYTHQPRASCEAGIEFAEAQPQIISLSELSEFATEQKNAGNKKHVTRIFVKLPSSRLAEGVTFVDTPGLGSLAVAGAEERLRICRGAILGLC